MLTKLNQYKEFIAILVFFLGGFFWIDSQYPKKTDLETQLVGVSDKVRGVNDDLTGQILNLQCLLKKYMELTQLQISAQAKEKKIDNLRLSIDSFADIEDELMSPEMKRVFAGFEDEHEAEKGALSEIANEIDSIQGDLQLQSCGSG